MKKYKKDLCDIHMEATGTFQCTATVPSGRRRRWHELEEELVEFVAELETKGKSKQLRSCAKSLVCQISDIYQLIVCANIRLMSYTHICTCKYKHLCVSVCVCVCMCACMCVVFVCVCMCMCTCVCMCACVCVYVCVCV